MKKKHAFNFDGGDALSKMGASWFVSYSYSLQDNTHTNWRNVKPKSLKSRISKFDKTKEYHESWLRKILNMNDDNLNKNELKLNADQIKQMAKSLLGNNAESLSSISVSNTPSTTEETVP